MTKQDRDLPPCQDKTMQRYHCERMRKAAHTNRAFCMEKPSNTAHLLRALLAIIPNLGYWVTDKR